MGSTILSQFLAQDIVTILVVFQNANMYLAEVCKRNNRTVAGTSYAFDSIWAAALMLNKTLNETRPEDFVLGNEKLSNEYKEVLGREEFEGLSVSLILLLFS